MSDQRTEIVTIILEDFTEAQIDLLEVEFITDEEENEITQTPSDEQALQFHMDNGDVHILFLCDQRDDKELIMQRIDTM